MSSSTRRAQRRKAAGVAFIGVFAALPLAMTGGTAWAHPLHGAAHKAHHATASAALSKYSVTGTPIKGAVKSEHVCSQRVSKGWATCFAMKQTNPVEPNRIVAHAVTPNATPSGYGPSDIQSAYNLPSSTAGSGQTVAIVDAYDDPNAESDLATFRSQYGLSACTSANGCFTKMSQTGSTTSLPTGDTGWAGEISLDLDAVSSACPNCHILLVEANSASMSDLGAAVNQAVAQGAKYISNSYGGSEDSTTNSEDSSYYKHPGVFITASTGDSDYGAEFPATSQYVTAVGGTSLTRNSSSRGWGESVWETSSTEGTSSGCSAYVAKPSFQSGVNTSCSNRAEADVSMDADPATGLAVYQTYGGSGWSVYGGTSLASPLMAATAALAGAAGNSTYGNDLSYSHTSDFNDVTSGSNGSCGTVLCNAGVGWDGPTGNGTPNGIAGFGSGGGTTGVSVTNPGSKSSAVNTAVNLQLAASGGTAPYTWTATGLPTGTTISSTGDITGTPTTAGTYSVTATAKDSTGATGSTTFTWTITSGSGGLCSGQLVKNPGFESGATSWTQSNSNIIGQWGAYEPTHSGSYDAWLDGYGQAHTDTLSQSITIPAGCHATLAYYLHIDTDEYGSTPYDVMKVQAGSTTLASFSNADANTGYTKHTIDLSAYAGQTVKLTFTGTEDYSNQTSFVLDDVTANLS